MRLKNLRFLNAGYCVQNEYLTGTASFRWRRFHAVLLSFEHPVHGHCLIDTGYGPRFLVATARYPARLMRQVVYTPTHQPVFKSSLFPRLGIEPDTISHIFVSHYHADHIGGLTLFPSSRFVARSEPLEWLRSLSRIGQLHNGFLEELLPSDFMARCESVEESRFHVSSSARPGQIPSFDFWNDGSLILLDLPGHAIGQTGYILNTEKGHVCYAVDAFWDYRAFDREHRLPFLARRVQHSEDQYELTQQRLREFRTATGIPVLACHCLRTQEYVENPD